MVKLSVKKDENRTMPANYCVFCVLVQKTHKTDKINYFPFTSLESVAVWLERNSFFPNYN